MHFFGFFEVGIGSSPNFLPHKSKSEKGFSIPLTPPVALMGAWGISRTDVLWIVETRVKIVLYEGELTQYVALFMMVTNERQEFNIAIISSESCITCNILILTHLAV